MTRSEFRENVLTWEDLDEVCRENDGGGLDGEFVSSYDIDDHIENDISENAGDYRWWELRDALGYIDNGYDWYFRNGTFDYDGLSDGDFDDIRDEVFDFMEYNGYFEDEEEDDEEDDEEDGGDDDGVDIEECDSGNEPGINPMLFMDLFCICHNDMNKAPASGDEDTVEDLLKLL